MGRGAETRRPRNDANRLAGLQFFCCLSLVLCADTLELEWVSATSAGLAMKQVLGTGQVRMRLSALTLVRARLAPPCQQRAAATPGAPNSHVCFVRPLTIGSSSSTACTERLAPSLPPRAACTSSVKKAFF